ncbi:MAG: lipopolysaccharide biosynthesis protein [Polynucleobacter sp.]
MINIIVGRGLQFLLMLAGMKLITTVLNPAEIGRFSLLNAGTSFFSLIFIGPVGTYINRKLHEWINSQILKSIINIYIYYIIIVSIFISPLVVVIFLKLNNPNLSINLELIVLIIAISIFTNSINQTFIPILNLINIQKLYLILTIGTIGSGIFLSYTLTSLFESKLIFWMTGIIISQLVFGLFGYYYIFRLLNLNKGVRSVSLKKIDFKRLLKIIAPISISAALGWSHIQGYKFILFSMVDIQEYGIYIAGYGVAASLIAALELILITYYQPIFFKKISGNNLINQGLGWSQYAKSIIPITIMGTFALMTIGDNLTKLMLGPNFSGSSKYIAYCAVAEFVRVLVGIFSYMTIANLKTYLVIIPQIVGLLFSCILMVYIVPIYGLIFAPLLLATGGLITCVLIYITRANKDHFNLPLGNIIKTFFIGLLIYLFIEIIKIIFFPENINGYILNLICSFLLITPFMVVVYYQFIHEYSKND